MKNKVCSFIVAAVLASFAVVAMAGGFQYQPNKAHLGGDVTPVEAYQMVQKDPDHTFLVDCRTRAEYQYVGHPEGAYNIPIRFLTAKVGKKGYIETDNPDFGKALLDRFDPKTDTLVILCRSGNRSCTAANEAVKVGFDENRVFNMMGGFEGDKNKNRESAFYGQRWGGGWKNEGLPWTYSMDRRLIYQPDMAGE